jgi:hypothetical protein
MNDAPISVSYVPIGRPTGAERLGLGQVSVRPETTRALNDPEQGSAKEAFSERQAAIDSAFARQQPGAANPAAIQQFARQSDPQSNQANRSSLELGARARVAAGGETGQGGRFAAASASQEESAAASSAMRQRVEVAVRLALPSEEPHRQFSILV